jgi:ectoine hydroxylase-related dioxygenase (phytanoyl-CoA dioxygenase family)
MPNFVSYHEATLPDLLLGGRAELFRGQHCPSMGIAISGCDRSFTYALDADGMRLLAGTDTAAFTVEMSESDWQGMVADLESVPGILYGDRLLGHKGDLRQFVRWDPLLRTLYTGRPLFDAQRFTLADNQGSPLDPASRFSVDSDAGAMHEFLDAAGYLLIGNVFSEEEIDTFRTAALDIAGTARTDDQQSWWGKSRSGEAVLCRTLNAGKHAALKGLYEDERIVRLAGLLPGGMLHPSAESQDGVTVVFKNPDVKEGLSDLPWHRDCGMGGHAAMCPCYVFSIYLYDATPESGCLQFLPGSHHYGCGFLDAAAGDIAGAVTVPARAGDITIHIGDVMHAAPPPRATEGPFRQSVLLSFHPDFKNHRGERHYNDVLLGAEDGQVGNLRDTVGEPS